MDIPPRIALRSQPGTSSSGGLLLVKRPMKPWEHPRMQVPATARFVDCAVPIGALAFSTGAIHWSVCLHV